MVWHERNNWLLCQSVRCGWDRWWRGWILDTNKLAGKDSKIISDIPKRPNLLCYGVTCTIAYESRQMYNVHACIHTTSTWSTSANKQTNTRIACTQKNKMNGNIAWPLIRDQTILKVLNETRTSGFSLSSWFSFVCMRNSLTNTHCSVVCISSTTQRLMVRQHRQFVCYQRVFKYHTNSHPKHTCVRWVVPHNQQMRNWNELSIFSALYLDVPLNFCSLEEHFG